VEGHAAEVLAAVDAEDPAPAKAAKKKAPNKKKKTPAKKAAKRGKQK
jgi:hypothetical protein